jgi:large subunit ribosomal protein L10
MPHLIKELMLQELETRFQDIRETGCVLIEPGPLSAEQSRQMRADVRERGGDVTLVRNNIFALAAENLGVPGLKELLEGQVAVIKAENAVDAAKAAKDACEEFEGLNVRGGFLDGEVIDAARVQALAELPSREELLGTVLGQLTAPARNLLGCLMAPGRNLVGCLKEMAEPEEEGEEPSTDAEASA